MGTKHSLARFETYHHRLQTMLGTILDEAEIPASRLVDAMRYMVLPPGKALRPLLVYLSGELLNIPLECLDIMAAAMELMHCYSLIHDDLPAMDNDDFRRNKPSCHRAFDEATAILCGDALQGLAIDVLLKKLPLYLPSDRVIAIATQLLSASGASGMVSGQSLDLSELHQVGVTDAMLRKVHSLKTGKLIVCCINMVLIAAQADLKVSQALQAYAVLLGLVFQMQDDYLDAHAALELLGKKRASDAANQKTTFASLYSQSSLLELITESYKHAKDALYLFNGQASGLLELTEQMQQRGE